MRAQGKATSPDGRALLFTGGSSVRSGFVFRERSDGTGVVDTVLRLARGLNEVMLTPDSDHRIRVISVHRARADEVALS